MAEQAAAGLETGSGEVAARWLDAEDATAHQALAWATGYDPDTAQRLAIGLATRRSVSDLWSLRDA